MAREPIELGTNKGTQTAERRGSHVGVTQLTALGDACCGCGACAARCPNSCLVMEEDRFGFRRPTITGARCIGCGACAGVCPALATFEHDDCQEVFWATARDGELLSVSSSGGVFGMLARTVIARGGVVCGAAWGAGCREVRHVLVESAGELDRVQRSKYVQSVVGGEVYAGVRDALRSGRDVLFCGTACQVAAMRLSLGDLAWSEHLLLADVICHGVPSPLLWRRWLAHNERRWKGSVRDVNFRCKTSGWTSYSVLYKYRTLKDVEDAKERHPFHKDWYMKAFLQNASLRPSCYACPCKGRCGSDITLGDYWGIGEMHPDAFDNAGVSAIVCHTSRGMAALQSVSPRFRCGRSTFDFVLQGNPPLLKSPSCHRDRKRFMRALMMRVPVAIMMYFWDFRDKRPSRMRVLLSRVKRSITRRFAAI